MRPILSAILLLLVAGCAPRSATGSPSATPACTATRVLIVNNGGDEAVNVYAVNGRTSTDIGTAAPGRKEIIIKPTVRATSYFAVAISRLAIGGSVMSAPVETRVTFQEECRPNG